MTVERDPRWLFEFEGKWVMLQTTVPGAQPTKLLLHKAWLEPSGALQFVELESEAGGRIVVFPPGIAWIRERS